MPNHSVVHVELPANDPQKAGEFYKELFGWPYETDAQFNYTQFKPENGPGGAYVLVGGMESDPNAYQPGQAVVYVGTDDIDATLKQAEALGAKVIMPKMEIPGSGEMAMFTDPTGNRIGLFHYYT